MPANAAKRLVVEIFYILFGTALAGFAIALLITPAKIVGGGASGIGTIFYHLFGFDTGLVMIIVNIPIFFTGILVFGKAYALRSFLGAIVLSVWVSVFGQLTSYQGILPYVDRVDTLLSAIFGGAILGAGIGVVMKSGANTGVKWLMIWARMSVPPVFAPLFLTTPIPAPRRAPPKIAESSVSTRST